MVRVMVLAFWADLPDERLAVEIRCNLLYRQFLGVGLFEPTPAESTITNFRNRLGDEGVRTDVVLDEESVALDPGAAVIGDGLYNNATTREQVQDRGRVRGDVEPESANSTGGAGGTRPVNEFPGGLLSPLDSSTARDHRSFAWRVHDGYTSLPRFRLCGFARLWVRDDDPPVEFPRAGAGLEGRRAAR